MFGYLYAGELPRRKHTTIRTSRKFEIKKPRRINLYESGEAGINQIFECNTHKYHYSDD